MKRTYQRWTDPQIEKLFALVATQLATGRSRISWKLISLQIEKSPRQCFDLWTQRNKDTTTPVHKEINMLNLPLLNFAEDEQNCDYNFNFGLD